MAGGKEEDLIARINDLRTSMTEDNQTEVEAEIIQIEDLLTKDSD